MAASGNFALWAWLAPGLAFLLLSLIVPLRRSGIPAAVLSIVLSAGALVAAVFAWHSAVPDMARRILWEWIPVEDGVLTSVGVLADADSTLMLIMVALVSFLVQVYSLGYLADEPPASASSCSASTWARRASRPNSRSTSGYPTRWRARPRSPP